LVPNGAFRLFIPTVYPNRSRLRLVRQPLFISRPAAVGSVGALLAVARFGMAVAGDEVEALGVARIAVVERVLRGVAQPPDPAYLMALRLSLFAGVAGGRPAVHDQERVRRACERRQRREGGPDALPLGVLDVVDGVVVGPFVTDALRKAGF